MFTSERYVWLYYHSNKRLWKVLSADRSSMTILGERIVKLLVEELLAKRKGFVVEAFGAVGSRVGFGEFKNYTDCPHGRSYWR